MAELKNIENEHHSLLKTYIPLVKGISETFGESCEVVLHDVSSQEASIIAIENGHITNRDVGSPVTDFLLELCHTSDSEQEIVTNYITRTKDGKTLKSSTILIRDENHKIIGALCINIDLTQAQMAQNFLQQILYIEKEETQENFPEDVTDFLSVMIANSINQVNKPVALFTKEDKVAVVQYLDRNNIFNIKGAVDKLALELNVSRYTIYNYLDEVRAS